MKCNMVSVSKILTQNKMEPADWLDNQKTPKIVVKWFFQDYYSILLATGFYMPYLWGLWVFKLVRFEGNGSEIGSWISEWRPWQRLQVNYTSTACRFFLRVPLSHLLEGPKISKSFWQVLKVLITQIMTHFPAYVSNVVASAIYVKITLEK